MSNALCNVPSKPKKHIKMSKNHLILHKIKSIIKGQNLPLVKMGNLVQNDWLVIIKIYLYNEFSPFFSSLSRISFLFFVFFSFWVFYYSTAWDLLFMIIDF